MVFASLLGTAKQPRRRQSSAASGRSGFLRPGSSSSARTVGENEKGKDVEDAIDDDEDDTGGEDDANDANDAASTRTTNSAHSARRGGGVRSGRSTAATSASSPPLHPPDFIADETHLAPVFLEAPDLRELNNSLAALAVVFPDVQVDVFREMLTSFDGESRLALVADALLKSRATWVKGRWRIADKDKSPPLSAPSSSSSASSTVAPTTSAISTAERFRTPEYKKAVKTLASHEFMGLSRSTINAVLAEQNYAYLDARRTLVEMSSKSWRFTLSSLFLRRKPVTSTEAENHPLIVWKSTGQGSIIPTIKATGSAELDRELYTALVAPLRAQKRSEQEDADRTMASALNTAEAEAAGATFECACCFTSTTFEEVTTCSNGDGGDDGAHVICFRCVQHSVREAVFGQGWARTIDTSRGTLWCPAVSHTECRGIIPVDHMQRALLDEKRGADTLQHLERRLADHSLVGSGLPLVRCPFCAYAEIDDIYVPFHEAPLRIRVDGLYSLAFILLVSGVTHVLILPLLVLLVLVTILPGFMAPVGLASWVVSAWSVLKLNFGGVGSTNGNSSSSSNNNNGTLRRRRTPAFSKPNYFCEQVAAAVTRFRRRRRGQQFRCQNPACARVSCIGCSKAWTDIHVCHESSLVALRTQVEQAMSMAIKRVCPRCHTSFVKAVGCNKLTCPCGYKMCYVCRKDISGNEGPDAGYRHFCDHFRPHGDGRPCTQCRRCNLWETEDTEAVLQAAREEAERKWRETEQRDLSLSERAYLETGIAIGGGTAAGGSVSVGNSGAGGPGVGFGGTPTGAIIARRAMTGVVSWATSLLSWSPLSDKEEGGGPRTAADAFDTANQSRFPTLAETLDWLLESILV